MSEKCLEKFIGSVLDAFDDLPGDLKGELMDYDLGKIIENKLQEADMLHSED
jgi:hypothetical protein